MQDLKLEIPEEKEPEFRFKSKKEYEEAMKQSLSQKATSLRQGKKHVDTYDALVDEYLNFCSAEENG